MHRIVRMIGIVFISLTLGATSYAKDSKVTFTVDFEQCTEFVGITSVPIGNVIDLVPSSVTIVRDEGTNARIVVRIVDCEAIRVDGQKRARPGRLSQIGVTVEGDGSADIDNYTLWYGTTNARLKARLTAAGMRTVRVRRFVFDADVDDDGMGTLFTRVSARRLPNHAVQSEILGMAPSSVPFVARWVTDGRRGTVEMVTTFPNLFFGGAVSELTTPINSELAAVLGTDVATFGGLDSYNGWDIATMVVTVD